MFFKRLNVPVQKLENIIELHDVISHNKLYSLLVQAETDHAKLPVVVDGFASEGIVQFFLEEAQDENDFNIYILDESNRVEVYHHYEDSKEELVRGVNRFYSSSYDHSVCGSSLINFDLPQSCQIVKVDGREQVASFHTESTGSTPPVSQGHDTPLLQQYFS